MVLCHKMAVLSSSDCFWSSSVLSSAIWKLFIMLSLLQLAYALTVSPLVQQAGANPLPQIHAVSAPDLKGAVASESAICTNIGIDLLRQGGNAADAVSFDESGL
jgi:hypothetical protein